MLHLIAALLLGMVVHQTFADEPEAIVGGITAVPGEFPHQCGLNTYNFHTCGCSILSETKILIAAHCVDKASPPYNDLTISTGSIDISSGIIHTVKHIEIHADYTPDRKHSWINDIAVITLHEPIKFSTYAKPIKLPSSPPQPGTSCVTTGWGKTSTTGDGSEKLLKMNTKLVDNNSCMNALNMNIYNSHICAFSSAGIGACSGDSGGPLVCNGEQYGIASFVIPCAAGFPDVYTSVYHHRNFIKRAMAN